MLKTTTAVMVAATIAAAVTVLSAPTTHVDASPLAKPAGRADDRLRATGLALSATASARRSATRTSGW